MVLQLLLIICLTLCYIFQYISYDLIDSYVIIGGVILVKIEWSIVSEALERSR